MCFAVPKKITQIKGRDAILEDGKVVDLRLVGSCEIGDYVACNGPIAVSRLNSGDANEARKIIKKNI